MSRALVVSAILLCLAAPLAQAKERPTTRAQIDYPAFTQISNDVAGYRRDRLISLARFHQMSAEGDTLILDARSPAAYARGHIRGAINVPFTDFTDVYLRQMIGANPNRRILIYCNNNFSNNAQPVLTKAAPLALNIPTFINLYGYGYRNVYELGDVVDFNDPEVRWVTGVS